MSRNEHGRLPLHHAVICNRPAMVRLLLELGADVTAMDLAGTAPISCASEATVAGGIVQMLLDAGGKLDLTRALRLGRYDLADTMLADDPLRLGPGRQRQPRSASGRRSEGRCGDTLADRARRRRQCQAPALRLQPYGAAHVRRAWVRRHRRAAGRQSEHDHPGRQMQGRRAGLGPVLNRSQAHPRAPRRTSRQGVNSAANLIRGRHCLAGPRAIG